MIRIRCPHCKQCTSIRVMPDPETSCPCPNCRVVSPFRDWENMDDIQRDKEAEAQRRREAVLAAQREREAAAQREREAALAAQREREAAAQREREAALAAQRERDAAAQREREAAWAAQRERELAERRRIDEEEREKRKAGTIGSLVSLSTGEVYKLFPGRVTVGRMASSSNADFQIPDRTGMQKMSRVHLVINVLKENGKYVHYVSLASPKTNETYVNNMLLMYGQQWLLSPGDIIQLPDEFLKFEVNQVYPRNEEETELVY